MTFSSGIKQLFQAFKQDHDGKVSEPGPRKHVEHSRESTFSSEQDLKTARDRQMIEETAKRIKEEEKALQLVSPPRVEEPAAGIMYGVRGYDDIQGGTVDPSDWLDLSLLVDPKLNEQAEKVITFRARIHTIRSMSPHLIFIVFRQQTTTIQGVLRSGRVSSGPSEHMISWASRLPVESVVVVQGTLQKPRKEVKGTRISGVELFVEGLWAIAQPRRKATFDVYEAEEEDLKRLEQVRELETKSGLQKGQQREGDHEEDELEVTRTQIIPTKMHLSNRIVDLRAPTSQAIFHVSSTLTDCFRQYLASPPPIQYLLERASGPTNGHTAASTSGSRKPFLEVHTPKLQPGATESGAAVFHVSYFGRPACLAQSPQFSKQMCMAADFGRVFEIGPVFRAENSNDKRHLTEYTGLDLEMTIKHHYHEAMYLIDDLLKSIFSGIYKRNRAEIDLIKRHFPHEDLVWLLNTPVFKFADAVKMLNETGWEEQDGSPADPNADLSTPAERRIGALVKERYQTDYYIIDKFPAAARPFYTMLDKADRKITHSFDIFVRGQEIVTGGQRLHLADELQDRIEELGMEYDDMDQDYLSGFDLGAPPHAGCGIGLERLVFLLLDLGNIRLASLFPRDPKSLPKKAKTFRLRHPEASTNPPPWGRHENQRRDFQPLEKLIANYGDADNTSWLDDKYQIWRHHETGAAIAYTPAKHRCVILTGNPLCAPQQYEMVVREFLSFCKTELRLKPIYILVGSEMEEILAENFGWSSLTVVAESRLKDPGSIDENIDVKRKIKQASHHNLKMKLVGDKKLPGNDIRARCDEQIKAWQSHRTGRQVHLTKVAPWIDPEHRMYFIAVDNRGNIHALVVMAQLSVQYGYQIKWGLDFPGAATGAIEALITFAVKSVSERGERSVTFGSSAVHDLKPGHNLSGYRIRALSRTYKNLAESLKLAQKGEFRMKMGAEEDAVWICYPKGTLGARGAMAIVDFFED